MSLPFLALLAMDGLVVRTTTPLALCPTVEAVEVALSERMHVLDDDHQRWEVLLENGHRTEPAADLLRVQVLDERGEARAEQLLDVSGADCNVRAQTVALVVADYFDSRRVEAAPPPQPEPAPHVAAPVAQDGPAPEQPPGRRDHLSLGLGVSANDSFTPGFAARLVGRPLPRFELSALLMAPVHEEEELMGSDGGSAELWAWPLRVSAGLGWQFARLRLWLGPEALASYERGTTKGIAQSETNHRWLFGVGAQAGLRYGGPAGWAGYFVVAADYPLPVSGSRFEVDDRTVLDPGPVRWGAALGVEYDVF
jgi:hypothetical protein